MNLNEQRIQEILSAAMKVGKWYEVRELIELFESTYTKFTSWDTEPVPSEPQRPRWHRLVTNAVRRSPGRDDYSDNSWIGLRTRKMARNFQYGIKPNDLVEAQLFREARNDDGSGFV